MSNYKDITKQMIDNEAFTLVKFATLYVDYLSPIDAIVSTTNKKRDYKFYLKIVTSYIKYRIASDRDSILRE